MVADRRREIAEHHRATLSRIQSQMLNCLSEAVDNPTTALSDVLAVAKVLGPALAATDDADLNGTRKLEAEIESRAFTAQWADMLAYDAALERLPDHRPLGWQPGDPLIVKNEDGYRPRQPGDHEAI